MMYNGKYGKRLSTKPTASALLKPILTACFRGLIIIFSLFFKYFFKAIARFAKNIPVSKLTHTPATPASQKPVRSPFFGVFLVAIALFLSTLGGCFHKSIRDGAPQGNIDVSQIHSPTPHYLAKSKYGNPKSYKADGRRYYVLNSSRNYHKRGIASWYGTLFHGRLTSTREKYNLYGMTAASPDLPIPCYVRVTNLQNGKSIIVKVNDRGPFAANRIIDLSYVAAKKLDYANRGTALVEVDSIDFNRPYENNDNNNPQQIHFAHNNPKLYLQVGAFSTFANAERLKLHLEHITHREIRIAQMQHDPNGLYHVQIGPLQNVDESDNLLHHIQEAGLGHAITVIG